MTTAPTPSPRGPDRRRGGVAAVTLAGALALVGVAVAAAVVVAVVAAGVVGPGEVGSASEPTSSTAVAAPPPAPHPDPAPPALPVPAPCPPPRAAEPVAPPPDLAADVARRLADRRLAEQALSVSVWVEGWGEVARVDPERELLPASNQKLLTAMGALELLPPDGRFETRVIATATPSDGEVAGDLVLLAGGDPTLTSADLASLAVAVRAAGIRVVRGDLVVDERRHDDRRAADGWLDWHRPAYVGALSALVVDGNRYRGDAAFLADPALAGGARFADALTAAGVTVVGTVRHPAEGELVSGTSPTVAHHASPPYPQLVQAMLLRSDNMIAEALVREAGVVAAGDGSTEAGLHAVRDALSVLCVPLHGTDRDGSGLSRHNGRSAAEWRALLEAARTRPWWPSLLEGLPVAGRSGTLAGRLGGPATAGNVRAKTGSIIPGRALSGYATTAGGRPVVFSLVVNGDRPAPAQQALDELLTAVVSHPG